MGNVNALYYKNWSDVQNSLFEVQCASSSAFSITIGTVLTHYCISEWIWNSTMKEYHKSPVFLASTIMFWILYTIAFDIMTLQNESQPLAMGYCIALLIVAFLGFLVNLAFSLIWYHVQHHRKIPINEDEMHVGLTSTCASAPFLQDELTESICDGVETPLHESIPQPTNTTKPIDYIQNIKIFLTNVVIIHHCAYFPRRHVGHSWRTIILSNIQQTNSSYFMNLFFFFSGYFVPQSFDKKGRYCFLFERTKRLGIPFVVYTFFLGPYVEYGINKFLFGNDPLNPFNPISPDVTWFLGQLLLFNVLYAFACGEGWSPKIACPSLANCFLVGTVIGLSTGIITCFMPHDCWFFTVPSFPLHFLSYLIYFFGGAIAQRNGWLDDIKEKSRFVIYFTSIATMGIYFSLSYYQENNHTLPPIVFTLLKGILWKGILCMFLCLSVTVFFMDYLNKKFFFTGFFSNAMYTAYIIQFLVPVHAGLFCTFLVLDAAGQIGYKDPANPSMSTIVISNENLVFPGLLMISAVALLIDWPLAYAIRSIPGFSQVL